MEFVFDIDVVQEAISLVFDLAPSKSSNGGPVPIKIRASEELGIVYFSIVDLDSIVRHEVEADVKSSGEAIVGLSNLHKSISGFVARIGDSNGADKIKFSLGRQALTLTAKAFYGGKTVNQRRSLSILDLTLPTINIPEKSEFVSVPCNLISSALRKVLFSVSAGTSSGSTQGVLFDLQDTVFKMVSTNGVTLTEFRHTLDTSKGSHQCVLMGTFVSKLSRVLSKISPEVEGEPNIYFLMGTNIFWLSYKGLFVGCPLLNSEFPRYSSLFEGKDKKFIVESEVLLDNIRNILFNYDKEDNFRVSLSFMGDEFSVSSPACANEGLPLEAGGGSLKIDFNAHLLEGAVKNLSSRFFIFSYKDRHTPVIFEPYDSKVNITSIVAPLK